MRRGSSWLGAVVVAAVVFAVGPRARAAPDPGTQDARSLSGEATAAFRLGHYGEAAAKYEAAFALRPAAALLYNAAQSYRLAGNKPRALELYRNYGRLYPGGANAEDARGQVAVLKKVVEDQPPPPAGTMTPAAATAPTGAQLMAPADEAPAAPLPAAAPAPPQTNARVPLVSRPATAPVDSKPSLTQRPWFWVAVGAAVVAIGTTVLLFSSGGETFPDPTFGTARGN